MSSVTRRPRRWFQFSLRTFLLLMLSVAGIMAYLAPKIIQESKRESAIARLRSDGRARFSTLPNVDVPDDMKVYQGQPFNEEEENLHRRSEGWLTTAARSLTWRTWFPHSESKLFSFDSFGHLPNKEILSLLDHFPECQNLELKLSGEQKALIEEEDVKDFQGWGRITWLTFSNCNVSPDVLRYVPRCSNLQSIIFDDVGEIPRDCLTDILTMPKLLSIRFYGKCSLSGSDVEWVVSPNIQSLSVSGFANRDLARLLEKGVFTELYMRNLSNEPEASGGPISSESLKTIRVGGATGVELLSFGEMPSLESLELSENPYRSNVGIKADCFSKLQQFPKLKDLEIDVKVTTPILEEIAKVRTIETLKSKWRSVDRTLAPLANLKSLRELSVFHPRLSKEDAKALSELPQLTKLVIYGSQDMEAIAPLAESKSLVDLFFEADGYHQDVYDFMKVAGSNGIRVSGDARAFERDASFSNDDLLTRRPGSVVDDE